MVQQRSSGMSWGSKFGGNKRGGRKAARGRLAAHPRCIELLEQRILLTNTLYLDFGDALSGGITLQEHTTPSTAGWDTWGYLPPDNAGGGAGVAWLNGPNFTYAPNLAITYTPLQTVFNDKGVVFNIGQQPTNDPFQFQSGPQCK